MEDKPIRWRGERYEKPVTHDAFGNLIANSAGEPLTAIAECTKVICEQQVDETTWEIIAEYRENQ